MDSGGDRVLYLFLAEVSDAAQGMLTADQRAHLLANLRERVERDRQEMNAADEHAMRRLLDRYPDPYTVVRDEAYMRPIEETMPDLEPARTTVALAAQPPNTAPGPAGAASSAAAPDAAETTAVIPAQVRRSGPQIPLDDDIRPPEAIVPPPGVPPDDDVDEEGFVPEGERAAPAGATGDRALQFARTNPLEVGALFAFAVSAIFSQLLFLIVAYVLMAFSKHGAWNGRTKRFTAVVIPIVSLVLFAIEVWLYGSGRWGGVQLGGSSLGHEIDEHFYTLTRMIATFAFLWLTLQLFRRRTTA